jgi:hypothetical protein
MIYTMHIVFDWTADAWRWREPFDTNNPWNSTVDVNVARAMAKLGLMPQPLYVEE